MPLQFEQIIPSSSDADIIRAANIINTAFSQVSINEASISDIFTQINLINQKFDLYSTTQEINDMILIPSLSTNQLQLAINNKELNPGDVVYVNDSFFIVFIKEDFSLSYLYHEFPMGVEPFISAKLLLLLLNNHIENDRGYWQVLQELKTQIYSLQQIVAENQKRLYIAEQQLLIPSSKPELDMSNGVVLKSPPLIGLLGIEIGGIDLVSQFLGGWECPSNGGLIFSDGGLITLLSAEYISVNGVKASPTGSIVVLSLIGNGDAGEIRVNQGDIITASGIGNISFYPELS